jgi:hypothetical protein
MYRTILVLQTLLRQETVVTVQGVPLTSYMEGIIGELSPFLQFLVGPPDMAEAFFSVASVVDPNPDSDLHPVNRVPEYPGRSSELPPPPKQASECVSPRIQEGGGGHKLVFGKGGWGSQCRRRDRHYGTVPLHCILIPSLWDSKFHIPRLLMTQN